MSLAWLIRFMTIIDVSGHKYLKAGKFVEVNRVKNQISSASGIRSTEQKRISIFHCYFEILYTHISQFSRHLKCIIHKIKQALTAKQHQTENYLYHSSWSACSTSLPWKVYRRSTYWPRSMFAIWYLHLWPGWRQALGKGQNKQNRVHTFLIHAIRESEVERKVEVATTWNSNNQKKRQSFADNPLDLCSSQSLRPEQVSSSTRSRKRSRGIKSTALELLTITGRRIPRCHENALGVPLYRHWDQH